LECREPIPSRMRRTRRDLLVTAGGAVALAGCTGGGSQTPTATQEADDGATATTTGTPESGPVASAPLPEDTGTTYAVTGSADATVSYVGNWKCPFCAAFSTGETDRPLLSLGDIVTDYVEPGDLSLTYRGLAYGSNGEPFLGPDAPRATRFGLAVWRAAPASYWAFHEHVMANQPPESEQWATLDRLAAVAREAGVPDAAVASARDRTAAGTDSSAVEATTEFAADAGVSGTPALVVDGASYSPFDPDEIREALDALVG